MANIERDCFSDPWSPSALATLLDGVALVASSEGRLVGYVFARAAADEGEILNLAVRDGSRRQGVGRRLVTAVLEVLCARGVERVILEVRESNVAARAFYRELGFRKLGSRPRYYRNPPEDALILVLDVMGSDGSQGIGPSGVSLVDKRT
jgi:ribosomal-protein-alanine acetyltransferase